MTETFTTASRYGQTYRGPLALRWEVHGDPISDNYDPAETSAAELWATWRRRYPGDRLSIYWSVRGEGIFESAPGFGGVLGEDFLTFYTWPRDSAGRPIRWADLPVMDKRWTPDRADKGGFVQEHTGWKPSPLQTQMDVAIIARLTA